MIRVENLTKSFHGQVILKDLSLSVARGEMLVVLGESGTGKSVLLKHIIGLLRPDSGQVFVDEVDITKLKESQLLPIRRKIGYLFQEGALYDFMTVFDNIAFPLREHTDFNKASIRKKVVEILKLVDLEGVEQKYPSELSGGMKKRVGLARSLILDCSVLLCDEPTSGLDPIRSRDIMDLIRNVSKELGTTTVITSHDIQNSMRIADRLVLIRDGVVVTSGTVDELHKSKDIFVNEFLS